MTCTVKLHRPISAQIGAVDNQIREFCYSFDLGSNRASNFKSADREYILSELQTVDKQLLKEPNSVQMIDARAAKLSDYSYPVTKSSNWTAAIGYPRDRATIASK